MEVKKRHIIHGIESRKKVWKYIIQERRADLFLLIGKYILPTADSIEWELFDILEGYVKTNDRIPSIPALKQIILECCPEKDYCAPATVDLLDNIMATEINQEETAEVAREAAKAITLRHLYNQIDKDIRLAAHDVNNYLRVLQRLVDACNPDHYREPEMDVDEILLLIKESPSKRINIRYSRLDDCTKGIEPSSCWCIGAPTTVGKTMLTLNIAYKIAKQNIPVTFISTEMTQKQIVERLLTMISGINTGRIDDLTSEHSSVLDSAASQYKELPIKIIYESSLPEILTRMKKSESKLFIVDQIQTITSGGYSGNEVKRLGYIAMQLVNYAKKHSACVILTSQINRLNRATPDISGYRGSGEIEEAVDIGITLEPLNEPHVDYVGQPNVLLKIGKNRLHGYTRSIIFDFDPDTLRIKENETS